MIDGLRLWRKVIKTEGGGEREEGRERKILTEVYRYLNRARGYELHNCMMWKVVMNSTIVTQLYLIPSRCINIVGFQTFLSLMTLQLLYIC